MHRRTTVMDVPVIMQLEFQQSFFETVEVPQTRFLDRLPDIPVAATQRQVLTVQAVQKTRRFHSAACCGRRSCEFTLQTVQKTVDFPQVQFST